MTQGMIEGGLQEAVASHGPSPKSFMQTSWKMFDATRVLLESRQSVAEPTGLVAGMCLELALKAYLLHSDVSEDTLRDHVSHDLFEAWHRCIAHGLPLPNPKPEWVELLQAGYWRGDRNAKKAGYLFRYSRDMNGIVLPPQRTLLAGLRQVLEAVQRLAAL